MARIIPDLIDALDVTAGEKQVHRLLRDVLADRDDVVVWHGVRVCGREIDFAVFAPEVGLAVIEVKDWDLKSIHSAGPHDWEIDARGKHEVKTCPYAQARQGTYAVRDVIKAQPDLVHRGGQFVGRPVLPVGHMVAFTHITRAEAKAGHHGPRFAEDQTLFADDLGTSVVQRGSSVFLYLLRQAFEHWFDPEPVTPSILDALHATVFNDAVVTLAPRAAKPTRRIGSIELDRGLDRFAREIGPGPRLIRGVAGSGKTLTLVQHAVYRARYDPALERLLFTCYNLALAGVVREMVALNADEKTCRKITVKPVFALVGGLLGERIYHEGQPASYYDDLVSRGLAAAADLPDYERYDAVVVDEGQDLSPDMLRLVFGMLRGDRRQIVIAEDMTQDLFRLRPRGFTFASLGIDLRGRITMLPMSYRCTQEIFEYAHRLAGVPLPKSIEPETGQPFLMPQWAGRTGPKPTEIAVASSRELAGYLRHEVEKLMREEGVPPAEIGILYTRALDHTGDHSVVPSGLVAGIVSTLEAGDVPVEWFSRDSGRKLAFKLQDPSVKIGSVYSAKGLDFEVVFLVDTLHDPSGSTPADAAADDHRALLFVGATRARERLTLVRMGELH